MYASDIIVRDQVHNYTCTRGKAVGLVRLLSVIYLSITTKNMISRSTCRYGTEGAKYFQGVGNIEKRYGLTYQLPASTTGCSVQVDLVALTKDVEKGMADEKPHP